MIKVVQSLCTEFFYIVSNENVLLSRPGLNPTISPSVSPETLSIGLLKTGQPYIANQGISCSLQYVWVEPLFRL
jgi:hypothetical protein